MLYVFLLTFIVSNLWANEHFNNELIILEDVSVSDSQLKEIIELLKKQDSATKSKPVKGFEKTNTSHYLYTEDV